MLSCTTGSQRKKVPTEAETAPSALDLFSLFPQVQGFRLSCVLCHQLSRPRNIIFLARDVQCLSFVPIAPNKRQEFRLSVQVPTSKKQILQCFSSAPLAILTGRCVSLTYTILHAQIR